MDVKMRRLDPHFLDLRLGPAAYDQSSVWGRVKMITSSLHPFYMFVGKRQVARSRELLKMQKEAESLGRDPVATKTELEVAWKVNRWCTNEVNGKYIPTWGRLSFTYIPLLVTSAANAVSVFSVLDPRAFRASRIVAHGASAGSLAFFTAYQSGGATTTTREKFLLIGGGITIGTLGGLIGESIAQNHMESRKLSGRLIGMAYGSVLPALGIAVMTMFIKANEWSPFIIPKAFVPVYDKKGELLDKSPEAGYFAARETSIVRGIHAFAIGAMYYGISMKLLNQSHFSAAAKAKSVAALRQRSLLVSLIGAIMYMASLPLGIGAVPAHTSIAARRVDSAYVEAGVPTVYYYRGL